MEKQKQTYFIFSGDHFGLPFGNPDGEPLSDASLSTQDGHGASFMDSLFTATSAVCVTGLVVHDTATYWSAFGQGVILFLIQVGGMGVVTVAVMIAVISGRKISLMQRSTMSDAISAPQVGGIVRMTEFILKTALGIEILGALLMLPVFVKDLAFLRVSGMRCSIRSPHSATRVLT